MLITRLKSEETITSLCTGKVFIINCHGCKEVGFPEVEAHALQKKLADAGKVVGTLTTDYVCNPDELALRLRGPMPKIAEADAVLVFSCGVGVQTISGLLDDKPVYACCDTVELPGFQGVTPLEYDCDQCGECFLNLTGGICPIVDCSKSLVNGQCGGAKNGKCEIDPKKDCAWEKIYQRLEKQGRTKEFLDQPIQLRDYSVTNVDEIKAYVAEARAKRYEGFYGGVHPTENKEFTEHLVLQKFPEPDTVIIPLAMHIGAPANPVVQPGDTVKVGQLIGEQAGFISAPVHSSVSGTVIAVEPHTHPNKGPGIMSVVIKNDGKNTLHESVVPNKPLEELTPDEIIEIVKEKGIVGMGGATFPTDIKANIESFKKRIKTMSR